MSYATRGTPRRTMLDAELRAVLKVSGEHKAGFRDHCIISLAVGAALRAHEIVALNLGDVSTDGRTVERTIHLRVFKRSRHWSRGDGPPAHVQDMQTIRLPDATLAKIERWVYNLPAPRRLDQPLFAATQGSGRRLSTRRIRSMWRTWQSRARIARLYTFHELRHTAVSLYRERTHDIRLTQLFARHANVETTTIYDHPRDQERLAAVRGQPG
jgi:integrase